MVSELDYLNYGGQRKRNRHRLEIVRDILSAASAQVRKTRIMYQANLSYQLMEKYLKNLLESGLIVCDDGAFSPTGKGREFLQMFNNHIERCKRLGEEIEDIQRDRVTLETICFSKDNINIKENGLSQEAR